MGKRWEETHGVSSRRTERPGQSLLLPLHTRASDQMRPTFSPSRERLNPVVLQCCVDPIPQPKPGSTLPSWQKVVRVQ